MVLFEVSLIYLMMYYWKHMVLFDIMVHGFFMCMGYTFRHVVDSHVVYHWGVLAY
jgi:hypothetical protein